MKQMKLLAGTLGVVAMLAAQTVFGAGFGIYEGSARGNAVADSTADPASPSVLYNNAAGMTELEGTQVEVGATFINPSSSITTVTPAGTTTTDAESQWFTVPNAYVTHQINDKVWTGLGLFTRYGLGVEYPSDWPGRYNVREVTIESLDINPSIAAKVNDDLSLAIGLRAEWFDLDLKSAIPTGSPFVDPDLDFEMKGDSWGLGYNISAFYKVSESVSLGLAYDSQIKQEVEGTYSTSHPLLSGGNGNGDITTPGIIRFGTSIQATEKLLINAGLIYTMWSSYEELAIHFMPPLLGTEADSVTPKDWDDVMRYQIGLEYALNEEWDLRAGYVYDTSPLQDATVDYLVPANDRNIFSVGAGYEKNNIFCDVSYQYLMIQDRDVTGRPADGVLTGEFEGDTHLIGISVGYRM